MDDPFKFQSTLPHGERQIDRRTATVNRSFNPRSRTGSDLRLNTSCIVAPVSIHAPARGATFSLTHPIYIGVVSIHAPARGATWVNIQKYHDNQVSIHAPARGATSRFSSFFSEFSVSIHAPARGATQCTVCKKQLGIWFQSTLPHGERRRKELYTCSKTEFQSTLPHGERRPYQDMCRSYMPVSIHAPARGATVQHTLL